MELPYARLKRIHCWMAVSLLRLYTLELIVIHNCIVHTIGVAHTLARTLAHARGGRCWVGWEIWKAEMDQQTKSTMAEFNYKGLVLLGNWSEAPSAPGKRDKRATAGQKCAGNPNGKTTTPRMRKSRNENNLILDLARILLIEMKNSNPFPHSRAQPERSRAFTHTHTHAYHG